MLALMYPLAILFVYLHRGQGITCETPLKIQEPTVKHRPVTFSFVPTNQSELDIVRWFSNSNTWGRIENSTNISIYKEGSVYYLRLSNATDTDNGRYMLVYRNAFVKDWCRTNIILLELKDPPMFVNTGNFDGCERCVYGIPGNTITIGCSTTGITEPDVDIFVGQLRQQGDLVDGVYTISHLCHGRDHMKEVKCEVSNNAFAEPLEVCSKLYILKRPTKPELTMTGLKQGQPINVSCTSNDGRPAGNVSMHIDGTTDTLYPLVQTNTRDRSNTFTSTLVLTSMKREWNGKTIKCCVSHETLVDNECSNEMTIDYKFPPEAVTIQSSQPINEGRPFHLLNVTCVITNANPACSTELYFKDSVNLNAINNTQTTPDQGYTTTYVAVLNVTNADIGKKMECKACCQEFYEKESKMITVPSPISKPIFVNTRDFDDCGQCLYGTNGTTITIGCNTTGGSEPVTVNIYVAQRMKRVILSGGTYTTSGQLEERNHMKEVKCEVSNHALTTPLVVISKIYVMRRPSMPELHMNDLKEGQPINVSCSSQGGRPAANLTMLISGTTFNKHILIQCIQKDTFDISMRTFFSTLVLNTIDRKWNGRNIKCCVSHETFNGMLCSKEALIDYKFPPASVKIQRPQPIKVERPYYLVNVTCVITKANPACPSEWNFQDTEVPNTIEHTEITEDNGHTTTNVAFLNASKNDCGKTLVCRARCLEFGVEKNDSYLLLIPCSPRPSNFEELVTNITKDLHDNVTLSIAVTAYPTPSFVWAKLLGEGIWTPVTGDKYINIITTNLHSDMTFTDIQQSHFGRYKVDVDNGIDGIFSQIYNINSLEKTANPPNNLGFLIGSIVGGVVFVVVFMIAVLLFWRRHKLECMLCHKKDNTSTNQRVHFNTVSAFDSPSQDMHYQNINAPSLSTNTLTAPPGDLYMDLNSETSADTSTYCVISVSGQDHPQNQETGMDDDGDYLHPVDREHTNIYVNL